MPRQQKVEVVIFIVAALILKLFFSEICMRRFFIVCNENNYEHFT